MNRGRGLPSRGLGRRAAILAIAGALLAWPTAELHAQSDGDADAEPPASAASSPAGVQRIKVKTNETKFVPVAGLVSLVVTDIQRADIVQQADGFRVLGKSTGDTIVQAFGAGGMRIFVVVVELADRPDPIEIQATNVELGDHEEITSFWGVNRFSTMFETRTARPTTASHQLQLTGKLAGGDHRMDANWVSRGLDDHEIAALRGAWISKDRSRAVEVGDTAILATGSRLISSIPLLGAKARVDWKPTWTQLAIGSLRGADRWAFDSPVVGVGLGHKTISSKMSSLLDLAADAAGYQTDGRSGFVSSARATAVVNQRTTLETRASLVGDARPDADARHASSFGGRAAYVCPTSSYSAEYEGNTERYAGPLSSSPLPASHRATFSASRRLQPWLTGAASIGHNQTRFEGEFVGSSAMTAGVSAALGAETQVTLFDSEQMQEAAAGFGRGELHRRQIALGAVHQFDPLTRLDARVTHDLSRNLDGNTKGLVGTAVLTKARPNRWQIQGAASGTASKTVTDELPSATSIQSSVAATAQVFHGPLELSASASVQQVFAPTAGTGGRATVGVKFTPTTATQFSATADANRGAGRADTEWGATFGFTHYFGDAVRARPILELLSEGEIAGILCVDENADGECAAGEAPIKGVVVGLSPGAYRATTGADGTYRFADIDAGRYTVEVDERALRKKGRMTTSSRIEVILERGKSERTAFGVTRGCEIAGSVRNDLDMSGTRTDADVLMGGIGVTVTGFGKTFEARADAMGSFAVAVPRCGTYQVMLDPGTLPANHSTVVDEVSITVAATDGRADADLLVYSNRVVMGRVFEDANRNGKLDAGELPVVGATVRWSGGTATSDDTGAYLIRRLPIGPQKLRLDFSGLPPDAIPGKPVKIELDRDPVLLENVDLPVLPGVADPAGPTGGAAPASDSRVVRGTVFVDKNRNGARDAGEVPVAGATVRWSGGAAKTNRRGEYELRELPAGALKLRVDFGGLPASAVPGKPITLDIAEDPTTVEANLSIIPSTR